MDVILSFVVGLVGAGAFTYAIIRLAYRLTKQYSPGDPVKFRYDPRDIEVSTGIFVRRSSWSHSRVIPTSPSWWSAVRDGREVTVRNDEFIKEGNEAAPTTGEDA